MLVGYVSDERYVVLPGVQIEFENEDIQQEVRSTASGAVRADIPPGRYLVTLACAGYGFKRLTLDIDGAEPYQFRLLKDQLLGYAWPK